MSATSLRATYRLQFNEHFRLPDAVALVPYFHELGVSHLYASPLFKAAAHSVHGYDVCDFHQLNPEIGTDEDLDKLVAALRERNMGLILDIVPNHMGIATTENQWWRDVLQNGPASQFADYFDIQWEPSDSELHGKILAPVLGDQYERVLQQGQLQLEMQNGGPVLRYFENTFPIAPRSLPSGFSAEQLNSDRTALDALIQKQNYRLTFWGEGDSRLNYRRFFAISTLAAVRVEDVKVFDDAHALLSQWLKKNRLDGLRVDHPDGLRDPKGYLDRLRALAPNLWLVVEKILQPGEELPGDWPVQGTVGYDFLNQVNGLFIDSKNEKAFVDFYSEFTGEPTDAAKMVREKKRLVLETLFAAEVNRLVALLAQIASARQNYKNFSRDQIREALIEFTACFPVYRTYACPEDGFINDTDIATVRKALASAKRSGAGDSLPLFDLLAGLLQLIFHGDLEGEFVARFQQLSGPAMAKGIEDTVFFCLNHFVSLNEVGGDPGKFGVSDGLFHSFCRRLQERGGRSMLGSSTHDTKRGEDVRARLNVLSEIPDEWKTVSRRWANINERHRKNHFPDRNMEYLLYQTLVGVWPATPERILAYMEKASCEAKQHTDWNHRDPQYDAALKNFTAAVLEDREFVQDVGKFVASLSEAAQINSLAQTLVKLTAPGIPDIYQGNEILDFSLVDPDNRRPVDFELRKQLLADIKKLSAEECWKRRNETFPKESSRLSNEPTPAASQDTGRPFSLSQRERAGVRENGSGEDIASVFGDGLPKLWLIQKTLAFRARHPDFFDGDYEPVIAHGDNTGHVVAFLRGGRIMTVVPRFNRGRVGETPAILLPRGMWRNEFTGEMFIGELTMAKLFRKFPVALLVHEKF